MLVTLLHDTVFYGFPYKLCPKPKIAKLPAAGHACSCTHAWHGLSEGIHVYYPWSPPPTALAKAYEHHAGKALPTLK